MTVADVIDFLQAADQTAVLYFVDSELGSIPVESVTIGIRQDGPAPVFVPDGADDRKYRYVEFA